MDLMVLFDSILLYSLLFLLCRRVLLSIGLFNVM